MVGFFILSMLAISGHADTLESLTASSTRIEILQLEKENINQNQKADARFTVDPDDLITNKKLRAESGSTSRYSIATEIDYNGGAINRPLSKDRPNIAEAAEQSSYSGIEGTISAKWNVSKVDSLFLGFGVRAVTPFSAKVPEGAGERFNAADPSLIYQRISRILQLQSIFNAGPTLDTAKDIRATGTVGNMMVQETLAYDFRGSRFTIGGDMNLIYRFFNKGVSELCQVSSDNAPCGSYQSDYSMGLNPFLEYEINDDVSFRTVLGLFMFDHERAESNLWTMSRNQVFQSLGVGISLMRDFYVFPNIQFLPGDIRLDRTNVAITSFFNLF